MSTTKKENSQSKVKVADNLYDFDSIKADPREILPITWGKIGELENSVGEMKNSVGRMEDCMDRIEQTIDLILKKLG